MTRISPSQLKALEESVPEVLKGEYARRLRLLYPDRTRELGNERLRNIVDDGFIDADTLEIQLGEDVFRLIHLQFLPDFAFDHPFNQAAMFRILNNTSMPGNQRLDLIYQRVVPHEPPEGPIDLTPKPPNLS